MLDKDGIQNLIIENQRNLERYLQQNPGDDPLRVRKRKNAKRISKSEINLLERVLFRYDDANVPEIFQNWIEEFEHEKIKNKEKRNLLCNQEKRDLLQLDELRFLFIEKNQLIYLLKKILKSESL